ncbi:MAG: hypothetical protein HC822_00870 [Oscillochloris sp.]|nr:hypothetical protein [Oscillochloris sp.]
MELFPTPDDDAAVLVAILRNPHDLTIAREQGWYRLPARHAPARLAAEWLAFYQTGAFGAERWQVRYYAPILRYQLLTRREMLPDEPDHPQADAPYYRIAIGPLASLDLPVPAARLRRVTFICTTFGCLRRASDVRELFHPPQSPPDDIWGAGLAGRAIR